MTGAAKSIAKLKAAQMGRILPLRRAHELPVPPA